MVCARRRFWASVAVEVERLAVVIAVQREVLGALTCVVVEALDVR